MSHTEPFGLLLPTYGLATNGQAIASPSAQRGAVAQCAPRARTQGRALAKRLAMREAFPCLWCAHRAHTAKLLRTGQRISH